MTVPFSRGLSHCQPKTMVGHLSKQSHIMMDDLPVTYTQLILESLQLLRVSGC